MSLLRALEEVRKRFAGDVVPGNTSVHFNGNDAHAVLMHCEPIPNPVGQLTPSHIETSFREAVSTTNGGYTFTANYPFPDTLPADTDPAYWANLNTADAPVVVCPASHHYGCNTQANLLFAVYIFRSASLAARAVLRFYLHLSFSCGTVWQTSVNLCFHRRMF